MFKKHQDIEIVEQRVAKLIKFEWVHTLFVFPEQPELKNNVLKYILFLYYCHRGIHKCMRIYIKCHRMCV